MAEERRNPYRMYRFYDARGALLYVGQTGRLPWKRLLEHVCGQPWADRMARWEVDPRAFATLDEVLAAEREAIRAERPVYNWEHNEGNPHRRWAGPPRARRPRQYARAARWSPPRPRVGVVWRHQSTRRAVAAAAVGLGSAWLVSLTPVDLPPGVFAIIAVAWWLTHGPHQRVKRRGRAWRPFR